MNFKSIPNELLIPIIELINDPQDLYNMLISSDNNMNVQKKLEGSANSQN